jgi:hypothetical protein
VAVSSGRLIDLAWRRLPPAIAERWITLIRLGVRLRACGRGEKRVGQLGGLPSLPAGMAWPVWDGEGPLNFVASIDCAKLPRDGLDLPLPQDGTLLFFYYDPYDPFDDPFRWRTVGKWDPESLVAGARVLHVPAGVAVAEREAPTGSCEYECVPLTATQIPTGPDWFHPEFRAACRNLPDSDQAYLQDSANRDAFLSAVFRL